MSHVTQTFSTHVVDRWPRQISALAKRVGVTSFRPFVLHMSDVLQRVTGAHGAVNCAGLVKAVSTVPVGPSSGGRGGTYSRTDRLRFTENRMTAQEPQKSSPPNSNSANSGSSDTTSAHSSGSSAPARSTAAGRTGDGAPLDDSPELLRWRADILLDEMMLGAVDAGGAGSHDARTVQVNDDRADADTANHGEASYPERYDNGTLRSADQAMPGHSTPPDSSAGRADAGYSPPAETAPPHDAAPPYGVPRESVWGSEAWSDNTPDRDSGRDVYAPSDRGAQVPPPFYSPPADTYDDHHADRYRPHAGADYGAAEYGDPGYGARNVQPEADVDYRARSYTAAEPRDASVRPPYGAAPRPAADAPASGDALLRPPTATARGYVQEESDRAMSRPSRRDDRTNRRSNLLPRMSETDVAQLRQEMTQLTTDVERMLPAGHDWYTRSDHLLSRADHILRTTPERSAEVEYYLQQVRGIIQRAQQTNAASHAYRRRLVFYHFTWLMLACIGLATFVLYRQPFTAWVVATTGRPADGLLAAHVAAFVATLAAATLGAALGGLWNMQRYVSLARGFFDRKYGLRGLLLPLFALLAAVVIYALFALLCWLLGVNPAQQPLWVIIPAAAAFAAGFGQEHVYGTAP